MSQNQPSINAYDYNFMIHNLSVNFSDWSNDSGVGAATLPPWYVHDLELISSAYNRFKSTHELTENCLNKIDFLLLLLGVFGNMAALTTMFKRRSSMGTPSFVYHKALVAADLLFCLNFLFMKFVEQSTRSVSSFL
uniref:G-protein coupled receptors family 1 profile domain-containing protein n=1 Tax=Romanomermis culicivorax TaxID=13658 RepID=A0A915JSM2_ROMCU